MSDERERRAREHHAREHHAAERGAASAEAVIIAPALFVILGLILAVGNLALAQQSVETAAHASARTASLASTPQEAVDRVHAAFTQELRDRGRTCTNVNIDVDTSAFDTPPGTPGGYVRTTITCTMPYASVIPVPGLPGSRTFTIDSTSPLDTYRERG